MGTPLFGPDGVIRRSVSPFYPACRPSGVAAPPPSHTHEGTPPSLTNGVPPPSHTCGGCHPQQGRPPEGGQGGSMITMGGGPPDRTQAGIPTRSAQEMTVSAMQPPSQKQKRERVGVSPQGRLGGGPVIVRRTPRWGSGGSPFFSSRGTHLWSQAGDATPSPSESKRNVLRFSGK